VDAALVERASQTLGPRLASVQAGVSTLHQTWSQKRHETKQQGHERQHLDAHKSTVKFAVGRQAARHANANQLPSWRETLGACCAATAGSSWRRLPSDALRITSRARAAASVSSSGRGWTSTIPSRSSSATAVSAAPISCSSEWCAPRASATCAGCCKSCPRSKRVLDLVTYESLPLGQVSAEVAAAGSPGATGRL
jgi:hypothetical protein